MHLARLNLAETKVLLCMLVLASLLHPLGLTRKRWALRSEYLRLVCEAREILSRYSVHGWPQELKKWEVSARFAPYLLLQHFVRITQRKLGGMGSLGDVVIFRDGKSEEDANKRLIEIVGALYSVSGEIACQ
jgi:hypothetical protein